jgi:glycosyltransferase involved in cell wall biosynthesis
MIRAAPTTSNGQYPVGSEDAAATVLVIAYRMRDTIAEAIASALAQTVCCEIIVSDDCSGDGTLEAAQAAIAGYAGPHGVSVRSTGRNLGLCGHLNELAAIARGDVLVFLSGDDVAYPQRVERLQAAMAAQPDAMVVGSAVDDIDVHGTTIATCVRGLPAWLDQQWFLRRGKRWRCGVRCSRGCRHCRARSRTTCSACARHCSAPAAACPRRYWATGGTITT